LVNELKSKIIFVEMENKDVRWKQRFQNYEKALYYLSEALEIKNPDIFQKAGAIQFFEMSYELAWNTLKDYLEDQGFVEVKYPHAAIKKAFELGIIDDGHSWMELLLDRNLTAHTYDEEKLVEIEKLILSKYYPLLKALYIFFKHTQE
jgi:nucleotidyltransferase substrate binding protein (TIGR01987 family)